MKKISTGIRLSEDIIRFLDKFGNRTEQIEEILRLFMNMKTYYLVKYLAAKFRFRDEGIIDLAVWHFSRLPPDEQRRVIVEFYEADLSEPEPPEKKGRRK